jgi:hypothetical protein
VILAGCGAETERTATVRPDRAASDRAAIQQRVAAYLRHMLAAQGSEACAQFTPALRTSLDQRAAEAGIGSCAAVLSALGETLSTGLPQGFAAEAAKPERVIVMLQGDTAQASVKSPSGRLSAKRTSLRRVGARWLIDRLGVSRTG